MDLIFAEAGPLELALTIDSIALEGYQIHIPPTGQDLLTTFDLGLVMTEDYCLLRLGRDPLSASAVPG